MAKLIITGDKIKEILKKFKGKLTYYDIVKIYNRLKKYKIHLYQDELQDKRSYYCTKRNIQFIYISDDIYKKCDKFFSKFNKEIIRKIRKTNEWTIKLHYINNYLNSTYIGCCSKKQLKKYVEIMLKHYIDDWNGLSSLARLDIKGNIIHINIIYENIIDKYIDDKYYILNKNDPLLSKKIKQSTCLAKYNRDNEYLSFLKHFRKYNIKH